MIAIAHSLADSVRAFLNNLLAKFRKPNLVAAVAVAQTKEPRKPRKYSREKTKTFSELLDNLEHTFNSVKLPTMTESWLERDSIVGLKKLGVHVPSPWVMLNLDDAKVNAAKPLPTIMCLSAATAASVDVKDKHYPKIFFAVKLKKLPWHVARKSGVPYQFGAAFELEGKLFWIHMYLTVVKSTGEICFCDELRIKAHTVSRAKTFYSKAWSSPSYLEDDMRPIVENQRIVKNLFVSMHEWWSERDLRWNVVVKKNGDRVTFGVDNSHTPYYFKDRDKSIKTATGQTKKIVHYVKEHERKVNDKTTVVKEHIRGLQEFNWASYHCQVVSPTFQSRTAATFTAPGDEDMQASNVIYLSKLGKMLADSEELHKPKEKIA
jgi:hypothetical protein